MEFKLAMSMKELKKRTSRICYRPIKLLGSNSREVKRLSPEDMSVLKHLCLAAEQIDIVHFKLENHNNLQFLQFLDREIQQGNERARLSKRLFLSQKSMFSFDNLGEKTRLVKNLEEPIGMGFYPEDLTEQEFHQILLRMLDDGLQQEVQKILSQRTVVVRDGNILRGIDYVDRFSDEFKIVAAELRAAAQLSTDKRFNKYLLLQAQALEVADDRLDAQADKVWATLKGKFEFTICRESYNDFLTGSVFGNPQLMEKLRACGIEVNCKDSIGARVGLINKSGTRLLNRLQGLVKVEAKYMPLNDKYENAFDAESKGQVAVDVDLVTMTGEEGAYQAGIVLAQNLPNDDKLAVKLGFGRRNVYHRQVRKSVNKRLYKNLISESQFKYFNPEAEHWSTICHENTHSLGPKDTASLGAYSSILEEYKADMGMYAFLDEFVDAGYFSEEQTRQMMVTSLSYSFLKGKPSPSQAHRMRSLMICNYLVKNQAIMVTPDTRLEFNFQKIKSITKQMMKDVIEIQLSGSMEQAKQYVEKYAEWNDTMKRVAGKIRQFSKALNGYLVSPLADELCGKIDKQK